MLRFLFRRSLGAIVILLIISAFTFFLFFAAPGIPRCWPAERTARPTPSQ